VVPTLLMFCAEAEVETKLMAARAIAVAVISLFIFMSLYELIILSLVCGSWIFLSSYYVERISAGTERLH